MMATVIDIDGLLAPIPGERAVDPRDNASASAPYYRVKDARNAARAEERTAESGESGTPEAWATVVDVGIELIAAQAKDLEVAAWLTEALIRTNGFPGLRDGLTVIARLVDEYWDDLYPVPDEDGLETKVSPVAGLSGSGATGTLDRPIRNTPLTQGSNGAYSFWDYEQAVELEKISDATRRAGRIEAGTITLETFRQSVSETPVTTLRDTLEAISASAAALNRISEVLDQVAGADAPSVTALQELLAAVGGCLRHVAADRLAAQVLTDEVQGLAEIPAPTEAGAPGAPALVRRPGEFGNRDEALAQLTQIAAYFRRTEPHSPLSYTIEDSVRRARMSLPELLLELAQDREHVQHIMIAAGIKFENKSEE